MKPISCVATRRRLSAYLDGELPVAGQVAVDGHLRNCCGCADELAAMRGVGDMLRARSVAAAAHCGSDLDDLEADILSRLAAEREESVSAHVSRAFQDMRLGLAAVCSTCATMVSVLLVAGIFHFAPLSERPDSLAGMMQTLGAPAIGTDSRILSPRSAESGALSDGLVSEEDEVFALAAVVTRNGRVVSPEVLSTQSSDAERERVNRLLDEISRARFEPARMGGTAVSVKTVFVLARTTVRGKMPVTPKQSSNPRGPEGVRG
ncbi:MAG: anti-sigma factor [Vicinamibacterales bacterium]